MKVFEYFITLIFWLWVFIVPTGVFAFIGFLIFNKSTDNLPFSVIITLIGTFLGIYLAETIRKRYGLVDFFSRIIASPELDRKNQELKEVEKNIK